MKRPVAPGRWLWLLSLTPAVLTGCTCLDGWMDSRVEKVSAHVNPHANVPRGSIPAPLGAYVRAATETQAAKAEQDDFTIYLHEWCEGGSRLGPYGKYHLRQMMGRLAGVPFPIIIQPDPEDDSLNVARRQLILNAVTQAGFPDPLRRVVFGYPEPGGLYGEEISPIYQQMIQPEQNFNQFGTGFGRNILPGFGPFSGFGGAGQFGGGFGGFGGYGR